MCFGDLAQECGAFLQGGVTGQFIDEPGQTEATHRVIGPAGGVAIPESTPDDEAVPYYPNGFFLFLISVLFSSPSSSPAS